MTAIPVAVVGCGAIATLRHVPNVVASDRYSLVAVVDHIEDRATELADKYGVDHAYTSASDLLSSTVPAVEAALVCTPPHTHHEVLEPLAGADLHLLVEKPIASTPWNARRAVEAAADTDGCTMVGYQRQFDPAVEHLRTRLADCGPPIHVSARNVDPDIPAVLDDQDEPGVSFVEPDEPPDPVVDRLVDALDVDDRSHAVGFYFKTQQIAHEVNLLTDLFGAVGEVAFATTFEETFLRAELVHESGVTSDLLAGVTDRTWFDHTLAVEGDAERVSLDFETPWIRDSTTEYRVRSRTGQTRCSYRGSYLRELEHFATCIETGAVPRTFPTDALADVEVIADLYRAVG